MRVESKVTSISWIPSEAVEGLPKVPFTMGIAHYDDAPPDRLVDIDLMHRADLFKEANELKAWIESLVRRRDMYWRAQEKSETIIRVGDLEIDDSYEWKEWADIRRQRQVCDRCRLAAVSREKAHQNRHYHSKLRIFRHLRPKICHM